MLGAHNGVVPWTWGGVPREGWAYSPCSPGLGWAADRSTPPPELSKKTSLDLERLTSFKLCRSGSKTSFHSGWGSVSDPYSFDTDPDPIRIQGFDDQNLEKFAAEKKLDQKIQFTYPWASIKDVQATTIKKGTSSTSKHEILFNFLYFCCSCPSLIRILIPNTKTDHWPDRIRIQSGSKTLADEEPNLDPGPVQICYPVYLHLPWHWYGWCLDYRSPGWWLPEWSQLAHLSIQRLN